MKPSVNRLKIVADSSIPYLKGVIERFADAHYLPPGQFTAQAIKEADVLIVRSADRCDRHLLEGSRVQLITTATIGFDHIDTLFCRQSGIVWKNAPGCNALAVAQYVLAALVYLSLRLEKELNHLTIGIVGAGHVGEEVAQLCQKVGMNVLRNDPPRAEREGESGFVSLETLAAEAHVLTFHTPLTAQGPYPTFHLIDDPFLQQLQKKPWLINASRGAIHHSDALLQATKEKRIGALVLDCWENEPHIRADLLTAATIATPHIAGFSADGKANATRACLKHISEFYHIPIPGLDKIQPPPPANPTIHLDRFTEHRAENCILACFNPALIDRIFRKTPGEFESFRSSYAHHREFQAYTITGATPVEATLLQAAGFNLAPYI